MGHIDGKLDYGQRTLRVDWEVETSIYILSLSRSLRDRSYFTESS